MKIARKGDWLSARVGDELVMMSAESGYYIGLTEVGARIWELIAEPRAIDDICAELRREFEVAPETCEAEVRAFLGELAAQNAAIFDIHGGALLFGGGEANVRFATAAIALRTGRVAYGVDYRVPPDHPYPAALDDCVAAYRALLAEVPASRVVVSGTSAGGNLAGALLLRARDEGLPMPAGALLLTPELDLTESGDSFDTLMGLDVVLPARLMEMNLLYAGGADLADPYLSPLFGDVSGFPPTLLQAGTRDIFLSNAVRMHRKLRTAGVRAELHVWEGMPHAGFGGLTPEDREVSQELRAFIASL